MTKCRVRGCFNNASVHRTNGRTIRGYCDKDHKCRYGSCYNKSAYDSYHCRVHGQIIADKNHDSVVRYLFLIAFLLPFFLLPKFIIST